MVLVSTYFIQKTQEIYRKNTLEIYKGLERFTYTRVIFYVRREVDLMKTAKVNAYIMDIFGKIELLSIHAT